MALGQARGDRIVGSTSNATALMRAVAARERDPALRCPDFLADAFVADLPVARLSLLPFGVRLGRWFTERRTPGAYWYEIARVKHFDTLLLAELATGISQVVILGAGLDSRAYRFHGQLDGVRVFEIDHPVTASRKQDRVRAVLGELPGHVTYVHVDLVHEDLERRLVAEGFDDRAATFVLWSGVTMYLTAAVLDAVLTWIASRPSPSSIAFDYDFEDFIAGDDRFHGAAAIRQRLNRMGEPLQLGLDPHKLENYLQTHGLQLESNLLPDQLASRYLTNSDGRTGGRPFGFAGIAHARAATQGRP